MISVKEKVISNLNKILENIEIAKSRSPFPNREITIVAVTKTATIDAIKAAYEYGLRHFGENRIESIMLKTPELPSDMLWHMIGTVQRRKIPDILSVCKYVDSVDRLEVAETFNKRAPEKGIEKVPILVQINISGESTKHGFSVPQFESVFDKIIALPNLEVRGLMTIAPLNASEAELRKIFSELRTLGEKYNLKELSMGMSDDYKIAVEEGATEVRLGRAIFG